MASFKVFLILDLRYFTVLRGIASCMLSPCLPSAPVETLIVVIVYWKEFVKISSDYRAIGVCRSQEHASHYSGTLAAGEAVLIPVLEGDDGAVWN